jgi:dihydropyrimidinase
MRRCQPTTFTTSLEKANELFDLLITNGKVVSTTDTTVASIAIKRGKIVALLAPNIKVGARRTIDAKGQFVIPGGIDPHVHLEHEFMGFRSSHDFETGGIAAAFGGSTMVIDFAFQETGRTAQEAVEARLAQANQKATVDYGLHCGLADATDTTLEEISVLIKEGIPSFKLIMVDRENQIDDGEMLAIMRRLNEVGGLAGIHGENGDIVTYETARYLNAGCHSARCHGLSRPVWAEIESVRRAIFLARVAAAGLYVFHATAAGTEEVMRNAQRDGYPIYGETCPHYLTLTDDVYGRDDGIYFIATPPLRDKLDVVAMWRGLERGTFSAIGSDDCAFSREAKESGRESFDRVPCGLPGVETRLPILFSEGVMKGRISINRLVELLCAGPARIFGCYPQKGVLAPGSDADIVLLDPNQQVTLKPGTLHSDIDYSPYDGMSLTGYPTMTILRGHVIVENGQFLGHPGEGSYIPRHISPNVLVAS